MFINLETWEAMLQDLVEGNPEGAGCLSLVFYWMIRRLVEGGPAAIEPTINSVKIGLEWLFHHSSAHEACFKLFLYDLQEVLDTEDQPTNLIGAAIKRGEATDARFEAQAAKGERAKKRRPGKRGKTPIR